MGDLRFYLFVKWLTMRGAKVQYFAEWQNENNGVNKY
jgi:hypothetical protein